MTRKKIAIALSGGVDSSVAALLLHKAGYEVIGLYMLLKWEEYGGRQYQNQYNDHTDRIEELCAALGIQHYIIDLRKEFRRHVIDYFCDEYTQGKTPNPCIRCNKYLKFGYLLEKARSFDAEYLSTGHYARIEFRDDAYHLLKAKDWNKDQSYVLYTLNQEQCKHILFPLSDYSKNEIRMIALENNLPTADEPSSQDICFVNGSYSDFLSRRFALAAGEVVDKNGQVLGQHDGIALYTIGQRHGLGLASGERLYVTGIESAQNRIIVGEEEYLYCDGLTAGEVNWISGEPPRGEMDVMAKIRYKSPEVAATLYPDMNSAKIKFHQAQRAVTPGQAVVLYRNNEVIGGGTIESPA